MNNSISEIDVDGGEPVSTLPVDDLEWQQIMSLKEHDAYFDNWVEPGAPEARKFAERFKNSQDF